MKAELHPIQELINEGEHQQLDFKFRIDDQKKIARTLVAFANTDGGRLLIGVKDNGSITGIRSDEEIHMIEGAAALYTRPEVQFMHFSHHVNGAEVLEVIIQPSPLRPHQALMDDGSWKAWLRQNDENFLANPVLIQYWKSENEPRKSKPISLNADFDLILDYLEENESITLNRFAKMAQINTKKATAILCNLLEWELIDYYADVDGIHFYASEDDE